MEVGAGVGVNVPALEQPTYTLVQLCPGVVGLPVTCWKDYAISPFANYWHTCFPFPPKCVFLSLYGVTLWKSSCMLCVQMMPQIASTSWGNYIKCFVTSRQSYFLSQSVIDLNYMNRHFNEVLFFFVINPNMIQSWA